MAKQTNVVYKLRNKKTGEFDVRGKFGDVVNGSVYTKLNTVRAKLNKDYEIVAYELKEIGVVE